MASLAGSPGKRVLWDETMHAFGERLYHLPAHSKSFDIFGVISQLRVTSHIDPSGTLTHQGLECNILIYAS